MAYSSSFSSRARSSYAITFVTLIATLLLACTPPAAPAPTPPPPAPQPIATSQTAAPKPAPEDEAWSKVVAAARKEGVVTLYSTAFVSDIGRRIDRDFQSQYGIRVEMVPGGGGTLLEKIKVEQAMKHQVGDVFNIGGTGSTTDLVVLGGAERIAQELPALRDKAAFKTEPVYSPGGESLTWAMEYSGLLLNTTLVKAQDEPRSYRDVLAPRWKGQILASDPRTTGGGTPYFYTLRYYKVLDLDYYRRLAEQDMKIWGGNTREGYRMTARGEYPIHFGGNAGLVAPLVAEGAPLKIVVPEEGTVASLGTIVVAKGAPHPNAARVFVNWLMSREGQHAYAESASATSVRKDVPDFIHPGARVNPTKVFPTDWDSSQWAVKDMAAGTMSQVFGRK